MCIFERLLIFLNILYDTKPVISIDEKSTIFYPVKQRGAKFDNKRIVLIVLHSKFPVSMYKFQSKYTDVTYLRIAGIIPDPLFSLPRKPESFANGSYMVQCISSYLSARRNWRVYTRTHTHTRVYEHFRLKLSSGTLSVGMLEETRLVPRLERDTRLLWCFSQR